MAPSPLILRSKTISYKTRSLSLPTRFHPLIPQFHEHFSKEKLEKNLSNLEEMYDCVDNHFLVLSHTQQQGLHKWADKALDSYLRLLVACEATKDVLSHSRQDLQQLLSVLRRRKDSSDLEGYLSSRSKAKKVAYKSLKDLKSVKLKQTAQGLHCSDQQNVAIVRISNEAEAVTRIVLEALLSYIAGSKGESKWFIFGKLKGKAYLSIHDIEKFKALENVKIQLTEMDASIKGLEEGLDSVFRRLLKIRVSLLDILYN